MVAFLTGRVDIDMISLLNEQVEVRFLMETISIQTCTRQAAGVLLLGLRRHPIMHPRRGQHERVPFLRLNMIEDSARNRVFNIQDRRHGSGKSLGEI